MWQWPSTVAAAEPTGSQQMCATQPRVTIGFRARREYFSTLSRPPAHDASPELIAGPPRRLVRPARRYLQMYHFVADRMRRCSTLLQYPRYSTLQYPESSESTLPVPDSFLQYPSRTLPVPCSTLQYPESTLQYPESTLQYPESTPKAPPAPSQSALFVT